MGAYGQPVNIPQFGTPPYQNTVGPYNTGYSGNLGVQGGYNPFSQRDVFNLYQQLGQNNFQNSQNFQNQQANLTGYYGGLEGQYGNLANQLYSPIWQGGGGYTPDMMQNVLQQQGLSDVQNQLPSNYLDAGEQSRIAGNPYLAADTFAGSAQAIDQYGVQGGQNVMAPVTQGRATGQNILGQGRSDVMQAQGDPGLNITSDYLRQAGVSDQQVQDIASAGARQVGAQYQSQMDAATRAAEASGTVTPLGLAAVKANLTRNSAVQQSDALTDARLAALATQRQAAQNIQNTQLNAGQYRAGLGSSNALALQNAGLAENQAMTQSGMNAADIAAQLGISTAEYGASGLAGLQQSGESAASQRAAQLAGNRQQTGMYNQQTQLGINNTLSNRYLQAYNPWLSAQQEGRQAALGQQGYYGGQANTANQQRLQGWQIGNQGNQAYSGGYSNWGATGGQGFGDYFNKAFAGTLGNFAGGGAFGARAPSQGGGGGRGGFGGGERGRMIDHHQLIEVGEHDRPEMILPLDPKTPPEQRNPYERLGAHLGAMLGVKGYEQGGMVGVDSSPNLFTSDLRDYTRAEDPDLTSYARGGIRLPKPETLHMPRIGMGGSLHLPSTGLRLNMPIRMPRISQPIRPEGLPGLGTGYAANETASGKFEQGGIVAGGGMLNTQAAQLSHVMGRRNDYRMNMGRHNQPRPMPYSEMGSLTHA